MKIKLIFLCVFPVLLVSCAKMASDYAGWSYDGPVNSCDEDQDCTQGTCHSQLGLCSIEPPSGGGDLVVKVIPDPSTGAPPQIFDVTLDASGNINTPLDIRVPVAVNALTIARTDEEHNSTLEARVIFTDTGNQLPGRSARITVYEAHNSMSFDLEMLPGKYRVMVMPVSLQADSFPVLYIDELVIDSSGLLYDSNGDPIDLVVPVGTASVAGVLLQGGLPINGLDVVAVDPTNGRIISTASTTKCVKVDGFDVYGRFDIMIASGTEDFSLRISRPFEPHHPEIVIDGFSVASAGDPLDLTGDSALSLDPLGVPVQYHAKVNKPVKTPDGMFFQDPAPGCFVLFESDDVGGGCIEKWVTTNESGALEEIEGITGINLYPGDYRVTIIPALITASSATDYTAYTTDEPITISEASQEEEQIFTLSWRPLLEGTVVANGQSVPVSTLTADAVGVAPQTVRPGTSSTGYDGSFSMWLDEADYHVAAEAPVESGFAWGTEVITISGNRTTSIELPIPFVAHGTITPSSDQANPIDVGGSIIEWYRVVEGRAYAVGRSTADSLGHFTTLLAP